MKRGDVVRITTTSGVPIGSYFYVARVNRGFAYCYRFVNGVYEVGREYKFNISILYKYSKIEISLKDAETASYITNKPHPSTFSKELSKQLERVVDEKPEIVMFFNARNYKRAYCVYENAMKTVRRIGIINELLVKISGLHYL